MSILNRLITTHNHRGTLITVLSVLLLSSVCSVGMTKSLQRKKIDLWKRSKIYIKNSVLVTGQK